MKGPGIHRIFGWRPIGKGIIYDVAGTFVLTPLSCTFDRVVRMLCTFDEGRIQLRVNEDAGNNYGYSNHHHGLVGGAPANNHNTVSAGANLHLTNQANQNKTFSDLLFRHMTGVLFVQNKSICGDAADDMTITEGGGVYVAAGPYVSLSFISSAIGDINGTYEIFESVYGF